MSIFGRKEIARLKAELEESNNQNDILKSEVSELKEKCSYYLSRVTQTNREIEKYKSKLSINSQNGELAQLKEKCASYEEKLRIANLRSEKYESSICYYQSKIQKLEDDYNSLFNSIESEDGGESSHKTKSPFYEIVDGVRNKPKFMASIYLSKKFFLSQYEYKMYNLLENLLYDYRDEFGDLVVFSQVRLADIVKLFEENYNTGEYSFCDSLGKNPNKKSVYELINKFMPDFNNNDYKSAFLFPLLRSHIDFLICDHNEGTSNPILAIEVHGTEHDEQSADPDWKRIYNDRFKKSLFNPQNKAMNIRLLIVKNQELDDEKKLRDKIYTIYGN